MAQERRNTSQTGVNGKNARGMATMAAAPAIMGLDPSGMFTPGLAVGATGMTLYGAREMATAPQYNMRDADTQGRTSYNDVGSVSDNEASKDWHAAKLANADEIGKGDFTGATQRAILSTSTGGWGGYYLHSRARKKYLREQNQREANAELFNNQQQREAQIAKLSAIDPALGQQLRQLNQGNSPLAQAQIVQLLGQYRLNRARGQTVQGIERYFTNPALRQQQEAYYRGAEKDAMAGLGDQTREATQQAAFRTAGMGQQGSSMEVERTGRLSRARDEAAAQIGAQTQQAMQTAAGHDRKRREQLLRMAYEDDPSVAQANARQMLGLQRQAEFEQDAADTQGNYERIRQQASDAYGRALGDGIRSTSGVAAYYGRQSQIPRTPKTPKTPTTDPNNPDPKDNP